MTNFVDENEEEASLVLQKNIQQGNSSYFDNSNYFYIAPSIKKYPHQWLWDSCFHMIVNSHLNIKSAKRELETLLKPQEENGFLSHIHYWKSNLNQVDKLFRPYYKFSSKSSLTQTPVLAHALNSIYRKEKDVKFLEKKIKPVRNFYDYLYEHRRDGKDEIPLLNIIHTWESGIDNSPIYDKALEIDVSQENLESQWIKAEIKQLEVLKSCNWNIKEIFKTDFFLYKDLLFNCVFIEGYRILARLYKELNNAEGSKICNKRADELEEILIEKCWDNKRGLFFGNYSKYNRINKVKTSLSLIPLILTNLPQDIASILVFDHLLNEDEFWTEYPVPSVALDEKAFSAKESGLLWRGPTWININWFIINGLQKHGFENIALQLAQKTFELVQKSGFSEYYNPQTGEGMGANNYSWSTLVIDIQKRLLNVNLDFIFDKEWTRIKRLPGF